MKRRSSVEKRQLDCAFNDLSSSFSLPLLSSLFPARKKKRYKRPRKSKWSTGVIKTTKKKKPSTSASSSCFSMSSKASSGSGLEETGLVEIRAANCFSDPNSSTVSESSDGERSQLTASVNGCHHRLNGVLMNGFHRPEPHDSQSDDKTQTSKTPAHLITRVNGFCLNRLGLYVCLHLAV